MTSPSLIELYDYQNDFLNAFFDAIANGDRRLLGVLPTGTGKTYTFSEIAKRMNAPTLILAHRDELIEQAVTKLREVWPDAPLGVVKAERHETGYQITVASVQSLYKKRLETLPRYELIITDEAHHASAPMYRRIYHRYGLLGISPDKVKPLPQLDCPGAIHLGVTATPYRSDKKGLRPIFDKTIYQGNYPDFVPRYLADLRIRGVHTNLDLSKVRVSRLTSDFNESDLNEHVNTKRISSDILRAYREFAHDRKRTLIFCVSREHAFDLSQLFLEKGIPSGYVDYETPRDERKRTLESFRNGELRCLFNCMILTEGYDCPPIDCIILARPTKSALLLTQMIGRGTRNAPDKEDCLIIDVALHQRGEDAVSVASLFNLKPSRLLNDRKTTLTEFLADATAHGSGANESSYVDVDYSLQLSYDSIVEIRDQFVAEAYWHGAPATEKQMNLINRELRAIGGQPMKDLTRGQAFAIIQAIFDNTPATLKQCNFMRDLGIPFDETSISKHEAQALISAKLEGRDQPEEPSPPEWKERKQNADNTQGTESGAHDNFRQFQKFVRQLNEKNEKKKLEAETRPLYFNWNDRGTHELTDIIYDVMSEIERKYCAHHKL